MKARLSMACLELNDSRYWDLLLIQVRDQCWRACPASGCAPDFLSMSLQIKGNSAGVQSFPASAELF
jgi:hypothetical protein